MRGAKRSDADWNGIVIYWIERLARRAINESQTSFLKKEWWKDGLEDMISVNLSQKLAGVGIVISPNKGVQVVDSVPISALEKAQQEREINLIKAQSNREMLLSIAPLFSQCDDGVSNAASSHERGNCAGRRSDLQPAVQCLLAS